MPDDQQNTNSDYAIGTIDAPFPPEWTEEADLNSKALAEGRADEIFTKGRFFPSLASFRSALWGRVTFRWGESPKDRHH